MIMFDLKPAISQEQLIAANLRYFLKQVETITHESHEVAENEKDNLWQAVQSGLQYDKTAPLAAELLIKLPPFIERRGYANEWIAPVAETAAIVTPPAHHLEMRHLLGILYRLDGQYQQAISQHQYVLAHPALTTPLQIRASYQVANAFYFSRDYPAAQKYGRQARTLAETTGITDELSSILNGLGLTAHEMGNYAVACDLFQQAIAAQSATETVFLATYWMNYGRVLGDIEQYDEALAAYDTALRHLDGTAAELDRSLIHINRGVTYYNMHRYADAEHALQQIDTAYLQHTQNTRRLAFTYYNLGAAALEQKKYVESAAYLDEATIWVTALKDELLRGGITSIRGQIAMHTGDSAAAKQHFAQAQAILQPIDHDWTRHESGRIDTWLDALDIS